ncbi:hypothetical protein ISN45_Aa07g027640 [Arabidopsis thaliana x Arabidopsis arenosa]|nr:hypothetical protein ISN45_Aa07g027640 [Arabidopsis thaliana x Arabidopsis arenosa]KAG7542814.1 hypothetical protein ISN45_Aa07g027640 [Arabidopsis thaliana x Arabidopsis arenosa]KAG7542815.1 hypothetical protein ISN45_Aa07g027640 [Arabidopsis thaliana x Arabidopsis arenosa]KAG7542816.1 hypothetical protein ISN45_Aa07g027640 [Arabidopsis thaliana x Arabidopsis arenosa]
MEGLWSVYGELELTSYGLNKDSMVFYLCVGYSTALVLGPLLGLWIVLTHLLLSWFQGFLYCELCSCALAGYRGRSRKIEALYRSARLCGSALVNVCACYWSLSQTSLLHCRVLDLLGADNLRILLEINYALYVIVFQNREGSHELGAPLNSA